MAKFKFDIKTNNLSWEKTIHRNCDKKGCGYKGEFRAPKSRIKLNEYYYFCLTQTVHVWMTFCLTSYCDSVIHKLSYLIP